jgi:ferric-dicitrate binding protein FerR (iron transport regulator)
MYLDRLNKIWKHSGSVTELESVDKDKDWEAVRERIGFDRMEKPVRKLNPFDFNSYALLKVAALIVIILVPALILERRMNILGRSEVNYITASAGNQKIDLELPDGSNITLNANSRITYPEKFKRRIREVNLVGECWFDVVNSESSPFLVHTHDDLVIKVLGTSFSVSSFENSLPVLVHVLSGKVSFYHVDEQQEALILEKGELGKYVEGSFTKTEIENNNFLSWKTGQLVFRKTPLSDVAKFLSQYSGKTVIIRGEGLDSMILTSRYDKEEMIDILNEIKDVLDIEYTMRRDTVFLHWREE